VEEMADRSGVGETALGAAMMRAEEGERADRLFEDPLAAAFLAAAPDPFPDGPDPDDPQIAELKEAFQTNVAVRTRFFDDFLRSVCAGGCDQVVLLAAGLDSRAFRLEWPATVRLYELDLPEVFSFKEAVLKSYGAVPGCERITVGVDLRTDWPRELGEAGFEGNRPVAWTVEGLLSYLTDEAATRLLTDVSALSSGASHLALDTAHLEDDATLRRARDVSGLDGISTMWHGGVRGAPSALLERNGWQVDSLDRAALATSYRRQIRDRSSAGFLTATKRPSSDAR
jgi:methyltransferase (TIGR00027 family)